MACLQHVKWGLVVLKGDSLADYTSAMRRLYNAGLTAVNWQVDDLEGWYTAECHYTKQSQLRTLYRVVSDA